MPGRVSQLSSLVHLSFSSPESDVHEADHSPSLNSELLLRTQSRIHAHAHKHTHVSTAHLVKVKVILLAEEHWHAE